jgi:hypothetical protein
LEELKGHSVSLGIIFTSSDQSYSEHLDIAEKNNFSLRWALFEPTKQVGLCRGYESLEYAKEQGYLISRMIREANSRGINTWADLTVPKCIIENKNMELFLGNMNDIQFQCPPFFDISPNLDIWKCLPLAQENTQKLINYPSFREAYQDLDKCRAEYKNIGVFEECSKCNSLENVCSGGPTIAKKLKHEN